MGPSERDLEVSKRPQVPEGWLTATRGLSWLFYDGDRVWLGTSEAAKALGVDAALSATRSGFAALSFLDLFGGDSIRLASSGAEFRYLSVQEFFAWAQPLAELAQDKVAWQPVSGPAWQAQWDWMQQRWEKETSPEASTVVSTSATTGVLRKAVPITFEKGMAATANFEAWWLRRLLWAVQSAAETRASKGQAWAYAYWDHQDGVVGVTPETLFEWTDSGLRTHAVAGTRWTHAERLDSELAEFLSAKKDANEHALVVEDLRERLNEIAARWGGEVVEGERRARSASPKRGQRQLWHLVTPMEWRETSAQADRATSTASVMDFVQALHPTPALGVAPRSTSVLKEFDRVRRAHDGVDRGSFGAPLVFLTPRTEGRSERVTALVGIRQLRVRRSRDDERFEVEVGAGAGVVASSDQESEWRELAAKRETIKRMLGLSAAQGNVEAAAEILLKLIEAGARSFVYCAGARNAPLVAALELLRARFANTADLPQLEIIAHFEEREAGFFALGRARRDARPTVVICTSGTAVAELLPALTEALYVGAPLVALTADRPKRLRGTGAPQSIDQRDIFGRQVRRFVDFEVGDGLEALSQSLSARQLLDGPTHINFCCDEPLLSGVESAERFVAQAHSSSAPEVGACGEPTMDGLRVDADRSTLVIVSGLQGSEEKEAVAQFLRRADRPVYLEATSGLRGDPRLKDVELCGGEVALGRSIREGHIEQVLRLGSVPTTRLWRDLDDVRTPTATLSISRCPWSGLGRGRHVHHPRWWAELSKLNLATKSSSAAQFEAQLVHESTREAQRLDQLLQQHALAEPAWFRWISEQIPRSARVYVGNSLPIREWDLAASRHPSCSHHVEANRGVNGIDGQVSTALGLSRRDDELWIVVGDLTALYNLAGPWLRDQVRRLRIVVINNGGGKIFSRVFRSAPGGAATFENRHQHSLAAWAGLWNLQSYVVHEPATWPTLNETDHALIEVYPSSEATSEFWSAWEASP